MGTSEIYPAPPPKLPSKEGSSDSDSRGKYFPKQTSKQFFYENKEVAKIHKNTGEKQA